MKKYLLISVFVLIAIALSLALIFFKGDSEKDNGFEVNTPEIDSLVSITQAQMSAFVFVTQESASEHILNINFTPFLTFDIEGKEIESFVLENFTGTNEKGEVLLIHPTDLPINTPSRTFLFTQQEQILQESITSEGDSIQYVVVPNVTQFNEIANQGSISPYFGVILKNIAVVNYSEILDREGSFDGSKYLEYSKIPLNNLDTTLQFDIKIIFTDGSKYYKRLETTLQGEQFNTTPSVMLTLKVVE